MGFTAVLQLRKLIQLESLPRVISQPVGQPGSSPVRLRAVILLPTFRRDGTSSSPSALTHKGEEEAIALLVGGPAEGERQPVLILGWQPARQGLVGGPQLWSPPAVVGRLGLAGLGRRGGNWAPPGEVLPQHPLVVASPSDGSVLVTALLGFIPGCTATGLGQQPHLGFR